jgi:hypothetical protein
MIARLLRWFGRSSRGSATVECAIVLPVFVALVGGVYEFSFLLYQEQLIMSGMRDAARYLALTADPNNAMNQAAAKNLAVTGEIAGGAIRVPGWSVSDVSIAVSAVDGGIVGYGGGTPIRVVTVSTRFTDQSLGFLGLLGLNRPTISLSHQQRAVGGSAPG